MAFSSLVLLMLLGAVAAVVGLAWARVDNKRQRFRPFHRALAVGIAMMAIFIGIPLLYFLLVVEQQSPMGARIRIDAVAVVIASVVTGIGTSLATFVGYLIGHSGRKQSSVEESYGGDDPTIQMEETGNPYQPPST